ncbi:uncharacterized protein LOC141601964 [Silene latifolia]|uniref:uncharacterized protein LOC141601964 n=1 Tax=Silene latifolia TaxID=37657 RepID=UPI003D787173
MKARYYHIGDFMSAEIGHRPSYTWRSVVGARGVLERGLRRRIGDGRDTRVWGQAWVVGSQSGKIISSCEPGNELMKVADLLEPHGREWNVTMLNQLLLPFEVQRILNIRISPNKPKDTWFWSVEREGDYSVKTAYASLVGDSYESGGPSNWEKERVARWVWDALGLEWADDGDEAESAEGVREWVECLWRGMEAGEYGKCMVGCWAIWEHRNKVVFDDEVIEPARIVQRARDILAEVATCGDEGRSKSGRRGVEMRERENEGWRPAMGGYVKINVYAGAKEGEGVSTGVVCRDDQREVL